MKTLALSVVRHRRATVTVWIAALVALLGAVGIAGEAFSSGADLSDSESATAIELLGSVQETGSTPGNVVWHSDGADIEAASTRTVTAAMLDEIATIDGVTSVVSPYDPEGAGQLNGAENTAFAKVETTGHVDVSAVRDVADRYTGGDLQVEIGGTAFTEDPGGQHGAEAVGLIAALALLFGIFRSWRAAILPLLTGVVGVASSLLMVILASHVVAVPEAGITMAALVGLGVGIDYALFVVHRFRKALMSGNDVTHAVVEALDTSGRAVVFAGLTVMLALGGMFLLDMPILTAMALAATVTVALTVLAAITLLPALLGMWGTSVLSRRQRRSLAERTGDPVTHPAADSWARRVARRPVAFGAASLVVLAAVAAPVAQIHIGRADASADPVGSPTRDYYDMMTPAFGAGFDAPIVVVGALDSPLDAAAFDQLVASAGSLPNVATVQAMPASMTASTGVAVAQVVPEYSAQATETEGVVSALRDDLIPQIEDGSGMQVYVSGVTAANMDIASALLGNLPLYLGVISLLGFVLLAVAFRSVAVSAIGVVTNLLSIAAGIGAAVAVFQFGWGSALFGLPGGAPIVYMIPVLVAGVVFGLAMDYQVFLVSRMHEEWTATGSHDRAVRVGVTETSRVILTAALIMVSVFASFSLSGDRIVAAMGVGLAIAVLADAAVVRLTLVPALMRLLGRRTWSYPTWAERITPRLSVEGGSAAGHAGTADDMADSEPELLAAARTAAGAASEQRNTKERE